jgi:hypothetical protein
MADVSTLDNPIWHALNSRQRALRLGDDLAALYSADVPRLGSHHAFERLAMSRKRQRATPLPELLDAGLKADDVD